MLPLGLSSNALARAVEVTPARINEIVRERRGITADTALRLARFFGTDVQSWMNLQAHYDIECAQAEVGGSPTVWLNSHISAALVVCRHQIMKSDITVSAKIRMGLAY